MSRLQNTVMQTLEERRNLNSALKLRHATPRDIRTMRDFRASDKSYFPGYGRVSKAEPRPFIELKGFKTNSPPLEADVTDWLLYDQIFAIIDEDH